MGPAVSAQSGIQKSKTSASKKTLGNFRRSRLDYLWLGAFFLTLIVLSQIFFPERSSPADRAFIEKSVNPFGWTSQAAIWATSYGITFASLYGFTSILFFLMVQFFPGATPQTHVSDQMKAIRVNFALLALMQTTFDYASVQWPTTKVTMGNLEPMIAFRDMCLWMTCFELAWYTQHRAMHDVKFLWSFGHAYHHTWRKPEHMIGITNFAFDHVVEVWVTMSSSFLGYILFPTNYYVGKFIGFSYVIFAVLVHWDGFDFSRFHINHHYLVTKNYGSHFPFLDMFFGTYQWDKYEHPESLR